MPGKSRHKRAKRWQKGKGGSLVRPTVMATPAAIRSEETVARPAVPSRSTSASAPAVKSVIASHPYVTAELRNIGILAGIMLVLLIVLALVL